MFGWLGYNRLIYDPISSLACPPPHEDNFSSACLQFIMPVSLFSYNNYCDSFSSFSSHNTLYNSTPCNSSSDGIFSQDIFNTSAQFTSASACNAGGLVHSIAHADSQLEGTLVLGPHVSTSTLNYRSAYAPVNLLKYNKVFALPSTIF